LDGIHDIRLLGKEGVPKVSCPLDVAGQALNQVRTDRERLHAWIPGLFRDGRLELFALHAFVSLHPLLELDDLQRISRSRQNVSDQGIRIERKRRDQ